jgi:hypothetical protein
MKILFLLSILISGQVLACSCSYDYGQRDPSILKRAAKLIEIDFKNIQVNDYTVKMTAMAYVDPSSYSSRSCSCTSFVKRVWDISYVKNERECKANIINSVWNDGFKIKNIVCD